MNFRNFMKGPIEEIFKIGDEEHKLTGYSRAYIEAQKEKIRQAKKQDMLNRRLSKIGGKTVDWNSKVKLQANTSLPENGNVKQPTPYEWLAQNHARLKDKWRYAYLDLDGPLYVFDKEIPWNNRLGWDKRYLASHEFKFAKPKPGDTVCWYIHSKLIADKSILSESGYVYDLPF